MTMAKASSRQEGTVDEQSDADDLDQATAFSFGSLPGHLRWRPRLRPRAGFDHRLLRFSNHAAESFAIQSSASA